LKEKIASKSTGNKLCIVYRSRRRFGDTGRKKLSGSPLFFAGNHRSPLFFAGKNKNKTREDTPGGRGTDGGSSIDINEPLSTGEEEVWSSSRIKIKRLTCDIT